MNSPGVQRVAGRPDVAIVGGGIIGLLSAYELVQAGARVAIFDRQAVARESSWAGGGILSPLYPWRYPEAVTALAGRSQLRYPHLASHLLEHTGIDIEYIQSGLLISSPDEVDIASEWSEKHKAGFRLIDTDSVPNVQAGIKVEESPWIWSPEIAQVRNPRLLQALKRYLAQKGVEFVENCIVSGFHADSGRLVGIECPGQKIPVNMALVAAGAWSGQLLAELGVEMAIEPVRGQMLLLKGPENFLSRMVLKDSHYLIPRKDGRILVGSTLEYEGFDKSTTEAAREQLMSAAEATLPGIMDVCVLETQWAGLRPGSPDGIPYIGEHPNMEGLFVSSGHFRNGFVLAPASAMLAADLLLGRQPALDPETYRLGR